MSNVNTEPCQPQVLNSNLTLTFITFLSKLWPKSRPAKSSSGTKKTVNWTPRVKTIRNKFWFISHWETKSLKVQWVPESLHVVVFQCMNIFTISQIIRLGETIPSSFFIYTKLRKVTMLIESVLIQSLIHTHIHKEPKSKPKNNGLHGFTMLLH